MKVEAPSVARRVFARLCKGDNLILSANGPDEDEELFRQLEAEQEACREFFSILGYRLIRGDNCYYFTAEDEPRNNLEIKLEKIIQVLRLLDFLSTHINSFGEGVIFSALKLAADCSGDAKVERFLQETAKGATYSERLDSLLHQLERQGYLSEYDASRREYRVLSAINYLYEFADRIKIHEETTTKENEDAQA